MFFVVQLVLVLTLQATNVGVKLQRNLFMINSTLFSKKLRMQTTNLPQQIFTSTGFYGCYGTDK